MVFVNHFKKAHLGLGYLLLQSSHAQPLLVHNLSILAMFTLQPVGGADLTPLPAQQETERQARERAGKGSEELMDEFASLHCLHFPQQVQIAG